MRTIDECVQSLKWGHLYEGVEAIRDEMREECVKAIGKCKSAMRSDFADPEVYLSEATKAIMNIGKEEQDDGV